MAGALELVAVGGGASVLPDDRPVDGRQGVTLPQQRGLALVGDADAAHRVGTHPRVVERVAAGIHGRAPDLVGVVLDPSGLREVLGELVVAAADDRGVLVDDEATYPGGALVDGQDPDRHTDPFARRTS